MWARLEQQIEAGQTVKALDLIDKDKLNLLTAYGISPQKLQQLYNELEDVNLPSGSAHGDAHAGNVVFVGGTCKFIDWSNYKEKNTAVYDLLQFYVMQVREEENVRLAVACSSSMIEGWRELSKKLNISYEKLRALFILTKASHMLDQNDGKPEKEVVRFLSKVQG